MKLFLILIGLCLCFDLSAQNIDSVLTICRNENLADTLRARNYVYLTFLTNPLQAEDEKYFDEALAFTSGVKNTVFLGSIQVNLANRRSMNNQKKEAVEALLAADKNISKIEPNSNKLLVVYILLAQILINDDQPEKGLYYIDMGEELLKKYPKDSSNHYKFSYLKGAYFHQKGDFKKAEEAYRQTYEWSYNDASFETTLPSMASIFVDLELPDSILVWSEKCLNYGIRKQNTFLQAAAYLHYSSAYRKKFKYQLSNDYALKAIEKLKLINDSKSIANLYLQISRNYKDLNQSVQAYNYLEEYVNMNDSLALLEKKQALQELEIQYETFKKESKIKDLSLENKLLDSESERKTYLILSIIVLSILLIILAYILFNRYKNKKERELLQVQLQEAEKTLAIQQKAYESEIKAIKSQMNPHFFYNALNAIQSFIYNGEKDKAYESLALFSDLSRLVLDSSRNKEICLHDEIQLLEKYLKLETLRLPKIHYHVQIAENIPLYDTFIPPMILQPILENAVNHGLIHKDNDCQLHIRFEQEGDNLKVTIEDNGIGRKAAEELRNRMSKKSSSFSTEANLNRIELLNVTQEAKIVQKIIDKSENGLATGTQVIIFFPLEV